MTVIAWDGQTLAVDSMFTRGDLITYMDKLWMFEGDGWNSFVAGCGSSIGLSAVTRWYSEGCVISQFPYEESLSEDAALIVLTDDGQLLEYNGSPYAIERPTLPMAWGCGCDIAVGAMSQGANAIEAVKAACIHNAACGGDISYATADSNEVQILVNTTVDSWGEL